MCPPWTGWKQGTAQVHWGAPGCQRCISIGGTALRGFDRQKLWGRSIVIELAQHAKWWLFVLPTVLSFPRFGLLFRTIEMAEPNAKARFNPNGRKTERPARKPSLSVVQWAGNQLFWPII